MAKPPALYLGSTRALDGMGATAQLHPSAHHQLTHAVVLGMTAALGRHASAPGVGRVAATALPGLDSHSGRRCSTKALRPCAGYPECTDAACGSRSALLFQKPAQAYAALSSASQFGEAGTAGRPGNEQSQLAAAGAVLVLQRMYAFHSVPQPKSSRKKATSDRQ